MKKLLIALAAILVLLALAVVAVPFVVPVDKVEAKAVALVKSATGRDLKIGKLSFAIVPQLALQASDVTFANAPGATDPAMLRVKSLQVDLKLLPLLHGAVEVSRFVLDGPVINLEIDKAGKPNWAFAGSANAPPARASPAAAPPAAPPAAGSNAGASLAGLRLDDVRLVDGRVTYIDRRGNTTETLDKIDMKISLPGLGSPFAGEGSAMWNGEQVTLSLGATNPRALLSGQESAVSMRLASKPVTFGFAGDLTGLPPAKLDGTLDLAVPSLRALATWAGKPIALAGNGLGPLAIKGRIEREGTRIAFSNANIALDAIKATGDLAVDTGGARPVLSGKLAVGTLDLNPYLPPEPATQAPAATPAAAPPAGATAAGGTTAAPRGWSDAPIDVAPLKLADADLDLSAGAIRYRKIEIGQSALVVHLRDGKLTADLSRLALYQGSGTAKVTVDGSGAVPVIALDFALAKLDIGPFLIAAANIDRLTGTGTFDIAVTATGRSQRDLIGSLDGKGSLDLANGQIKGVNLLGLVQNAASSVRGTATGSGDTTDFGTLTATYTITKGILHNDDLKLVSGAVPMTGAGTADLPQRNVDYRVVAQLAGAVPIPIAITGPFDNLSYRPDLSGALKGVAKQPGKLLDTLGGAASGSGGGSAAGNLLKGLLGK